MKFLNWLFSFFGGPKAPTPTFITKAQAETVKLCGYLPQANTIVAIVGALTGQAGTAATALGVATTVCQAVSKMPLSAFGEAYPTVEIGGETIVIEGEFVGKPQE